MKPMSLNLLLPQNQPVLLGPPPTPRSFISSPMTKKRFPLQEVHFSNKAFGEMVRKRPTGVFKCQKVLGRGDGGIVYELQFSSTKEAHAIKVLERSSEFESCDKFNKDGIRNEILLSKRLVHPHITNFHATFEDVSHEYVITELCEHGSLKTFLNDVRLFNEPEARLLMIQLISAVHYLHGIGVSHNDIYPRNILVSRSPIDGGLVLKLADFGWADIREEESSGSLWLGANGWSTETDLELLPEILFSLLFNLSSVKPADIRGLPNSSPDLRMLLHTISSSRFQMNCPRSISSLITHPWFRSSQCFIRTIPFAGGREGRKQPNYSHVGIKESILNRDTIMLRLKLNVFF